MGRSLGHDDLPSSDDPVWEQLGGEVLSELKTPKTVRQLKTWAHGERVEIGRLVNALAWLNLRGLVAVDRSAVEPLWSRNDCPPPPPAALPKRCGKCGGMMKVEPQRLACCICGKSIYPPPDGEEPAL